MRDILVAAGSNLPNGENLPLDLAKGARILLERAGWRTIRSSSYYRNPAWPPDSGAPDYINAAFAVEGEGGPEDLLAALHEAEAEAGRKRGERYMPRTLDLDLIGWDDMVLPDVQTVRRWIEATGDDRTTVPESLVLPHPRMHERAFVLVPLAEIAPGWRHPILGKTAVELRDALPQSELEKLKLV